jgi:hypothetical protein
LPSHDSDSDQEHTWRDWVMGPNIVIRPPVIAQSFASSLSSDAAALSSSSSSASPSLSVSSSASTAPVAAHASTSLPPSLSQPVYAAAASSSAAGLDSLLEETTLSVSAPSSSSSHSSSSPSAASFASALAAGSASAAPFSVVSSSSSSSSLSSQLAIQREAAAAAASGDSDQPSAADEERARRLLSMRMSKLSKRRVRQVARARRENFIDVVPVVDRLTGVSADSSLESSLVAPAATITETERLASGGHLTSYVYGMANNGRIAQHEQYDGVVNKHISIDRDADTVFYAGPRFLFEGTGMAPTSTWQPTSFEDVRAIEPLLRPGVLLTSTGAPLLDMAFPMCLDITLKVKLDPTQKVQTKLRSMLRPGEEGWKRGFWSKIGHLRMNDSTYASVCMGDSRNHRNATGAFWDRLAKNLQDALWLAIRDTYRVSFDTSVTDAAGVKTGPSLNEPFVQMHSHTNLMQLEQDAESCLRADPRAVFRIETPAVFFRLLSLHAMRLGVCVSIGIFSHGQKYLPSQTGHQFCVPEDSGQQVAEADMRPLYASLEPFVQTSWADAGWKQCLAALVEALGDEVRYSCAFGMYISGLMAHPPDGEESPWLMAMLPKDRIIGTKSTEGRPFAYPVPQPTSVTVDAPAGSARQISLRFSRAQGDRCDGIASFTPEGSTSHPSQLLHYHPSSQLHRTRMVKSVLARLTNTYLPDDASAEERKKSEQIHLDALNKVIDYVDDDLRRIYEEVRPLYCSRRWELNSEYVLCPSMDIESLQQHVIDAVTRFVYCCAELPSVHFLRGADDMVRHSRMKLTLMVKTCEGLNAAVPKKWLPASGRTQITRRVMAPQISGTLCVVEFTFYIV